MAWCRCEWNMNPIRVCSFKYVDSQQAFCKTHHAEDEAFPKDFKSLQRAWSAQFENTKDRVGKTEDTGSHHGQVAWSTAWYVPRSLVQEFLRLQECFCSWVV